MPKSWFSVKNLGGGVVDVSIHEEIGAWGVNARDFIEAVSDKSISLINLSVGSPGGSFIHGLAMYHHLLNHPATVNATVLNVAGSAASLVLMAADRIEMPEDTYVFVHDPTGGVNGRAKDLREMAETLDKFHQNIVNIYARRTSLDEETIVDLMDKESLVSAKDAVEMGFADSLLAPIDVAALAPDFARHFKALPEELRPAGNAKNIGEIETIRDYEKALRDAGLSKALAQTLASRVKDSFLGEPEAELEASDIQAFFSGLKFSV